MAKPPSIPRLNRRSPLARGLVACYPLLGARVQGLDLGPYAAHLTPAGTQAYEWRTLNGHGWFYNASTTTNGQIGTTNTNVRDLIYNDDWTIALWVKQTSAISANPAAITWHGGDDFLIYPSSNTAGGGTRVYWRNSTGNIIVASQGDISGEVHRLVLTAKRVVNNHDYTLYQDREVIATANIGIASGSLTGFRVGGWADDASQTMGGYIAHVALWDRTLSADEVKLDYAPQTRWDLISGAPRLFILPTGIEPITEEETGTTVSVTGGAYTLTAGGIDVDKTVTVAGGSFTIAGGNVSVGTNVQVTGGTFSLAAGGLSIDKTIAVAGGAYTLAASTLNIAKTVAVAGGSYTLTVGGVDIDKNITLTGGTFTLTAGDYTANLATSGTEITVTGGSFTLAAGAVDIDKTIAVTGGAFTIAAGAVNLDWDIPVTGGSYTLSVGGIQLDKNQTISGGLYTITSGVVLWNTPGGEPEGAMRSSQQWKYRRLRQRRWS